MSECYRCGEEGHRASECEAELPPPSRYPPLALLRRPAHEIADAHAWAEKIRRDLGWTEAGDST